MTVEPYAFIRAVTLVLASFWTLRAGVRMVRFLDRWERRLLALGMDRAWLRRQALVFTVRTTVADPLNLLLFLTLTAIWSL